MTYLGVQVTTTPPEGLQVKLHANAKTTPYTRALIVERVERLGRAVGAAAQAAAVSERTVYRWIARMRGTRFVPDRLSLSGLTWSGSPDPRRGSEFGRL